MNEFPKIQTAIPQRRYHYGDFAVSVLGDIESGDGRDYQFVAAFIREGEAQPKLFVLSERQSPGEREHGSHALRVINSTLDEVMEIDSRWARLDDFTAQALQIGAQLLGLEQETPFKLM